MKIKLVKRSFIGYNGKEIFSYRIIIDHMIVKLFNNEIEAREYFNGYKNHKKVVPNTINEELIEEIEI